VIYVSDTHPLIFYLTGQNKRLGRAAARIFRRLERGLDEVRLSSASLFEISILMERGRLKAPLGWDAWLTVVRTTPGLGVEPVSIEDVSCARELPALIDPFDRLIAGTAVRLAVRLITFDQRISDSGAVEVVW
jgi:PIN domain nuclease of toxin-antitoxin system